MKKYRYTTVTILSVLSFSLLLLLTPTLQRSLIHQLANHYLKASVEVLVPKIRLNSYSIEAIIEKSATVNITIDYTKLFAYTLTLTYQGDIAPLSKDLNMTLPHNIANIEATLDYKDMLHVKGSLLHSDIDAQLNLQSHYYQSDITLTELKPLLSLQHLPPLAEGQMHLHTKGDYLKFHQFELTSNSLELNATALQLQDVAYQSTTLPSAFKAIGSFKNDKLNIQALFSSVLADITLNKAKYDLNSTALTLQTHLALKSPHLSGDVTLLADGSIKRRLHVTIFSKELNASQNLMQHFDTNFSNKSESISFVADGGLKALNMLDATLELNSSMLHVKSDIIHAQLDDKSVDTLSHFALKNRFIQAKGALDIKGRLKESIQLQLHTSHLALANEIVQPFDANFSDAYLDSNASLTSVYEKGVVSNKLYFSSPLITLKSNNLTIDTLRKNIALDLSMFTPLYIGDSNLSVAIDYTDGLHFDADVQSSYEYLHVSDSYFNANDFALNYLLQLKKSPYTYRYAHDSGRIEGVLHKKGERIDAMVSTQGYGKALSLSLHNNHAKVFAKDVNITKLIYQKDSAITQATLNASIEADIAHIATNNPSIIEAQSDINISDIIVLGYDIDAQIDKLQNYQNISILKGHLPGKGLITGAFNSSMALFTDKAIDKSVISLIHANTTLHNDLLTCNDCAIATKKSLIAIKGGIQLSTHNFEALQIGLIKANRCAYFVQNIYGSLEEPSVKLTNTSAKFVTGIAKSATVMIKDTAETLTQTQTPNLCEPFYLGVVQHP